MDCRRTDWPSVAVWCCKNRFDPCMAKSVHRWGGMGVEGERKGTKKWNGSTHTHPTGFYCHGNPYLLLWIRRRCFSYSSKGWWLGAVTYHGGLVPLTGQSRTGQTSSGGLPGNHSWSLENWGTPASTRLCTKPSARCPSVHDLALHWTLEQHSTGLWCPLLGDRNRLHYEGGFTQGGSLSQDTSCSKPTAIPFFTLQYMG